MKLAALYGVGAKLDEQPQLLFVLRGVDENELYQIALPATHLRRCGRFAVPVQVFDSTHVYDATIPAQRGVT